MLDRLAPLIRRAESIMREKGRCILVLDGMAAAGKTTAAEVLSVRWDAPVVHMDDFFLPAAFRTPERLAQPGGNVHYERFAAEVLPALRDSRAFSYGMFDCSRMSCVGERSIPAASVILVEGAYSMHPVFGAYGDVTAFFAVEPREQERRIVARGGELVWPAFRDRWIPLENAYHAAFGIRDRADMVL